MARRARTANLFLDLEMDPDAPWDQSAFESRIKARQQEWSRDVGFPGSKGLLAKAKLDKVKDFRDIAGDPKLRSEEARKARELRNEAQEAILREIHHSLSFLESKGYLFEEEIQNLVKEFADSMSGAQIRKMVTVEIRDGLPPPPPPVMPLDPAIAGRVRQNLDLFGLSDLYEFLKAPPTKPCQELRDLAQQVYQAMMRKAVKSAEVTAQQDLAGLCSTWLGTEENKRRYDETLRLERIQKLIDAVDLAAAVPRKLVQAQIDELVRFGTQECGILPKDAHEEILNYAQKKGYVVVLAEAGERLPVMRRCGTCGRLNDVSANNCTKCGEPLLSPCPRDSSHPPVPSDQFACRECGFPVGNRSYVRMLLAQIDSAMTERDYALAASLLLSARKDWPAPATDSLKQEIDKRNTQVASFVAKAEECERKLATAITERRYYAARDLLDELAGLNPEGAKRYSTQRATIDAAIKQAETLVARAKTSAPDAAIAALQDALRICSDCREAAELLAKSPPSAPANLRAEVREQIVQLKWQGSSSAGVNHLVVRKAKARPASADDGTRLASISGADFDDEKPEMGVPLYYAVFAERSGVTSRSPALLEKPVMVRPDVTNLSATVGSGYVQIAWQSPDNVFDVRIARSDRATPRSEVDGHPVPTTSASTAVDRGLTNGYRYYYSVWARFKDHDGVLQISPGLSIEATPEEPPASITQLKIVPAAAGDGRVLRIEWIRPPKGEVAILHARQAIGLQPGNVIGQREFERRGKVLSSSGTSVAVAVDGPGVHYFTPAVIFQQMAYVGVEQRYVHAEDVSDLRTQNLGSMLRLLWRWPAGCDEAVVAWNSSGWPEPGKVGVLSRQLTRAEYDLAGGFDIPNPVSSELFVAVYAVTRHNGERILAAGQSPTARKRVALGSRITIDYAIRRSRLGGALSLQVDKQGNGAWPCLLLIRKHAAIPLKVTDGEVVLRVETSSNAGNRQMISLPKSASRQQAYVRLFLEDEGLYDRVVIRDPDVSSLQLF